MEKQNQHASEVSRV